MKGLSLFFAALALFGTGSVVWQRESLAKLRETNERTGTNQIRELTANSESLSGLELEAAALREQTKDLPKLRNGISQLRAQLSEMSTTRSENIRLLEAKRTGAPIPREVPPGFIPKEQLRKAGYETPEDAIQTFFWAMREGDPAVAMESLSPENNQRIRWESVSPEQRAVLESKARGGAPEMKQFNDFTVAARQQFSEDKVKLYLRSSLGTNIVGYELKRFGREWKLVDF